MRTSVIIVTYNSRCYLSACLQSLLDELDAEDEIIVVDNGSSDGSADFICTHYPQVKLILNPNKGYAGGNNCGAAAANGEYLFFLNPDTCLEKGALSHLLAPLMNDTTVALTTPCIVLMRQPDLINTCGNTMHYTGLTYCRGAGQPRGNYSISTEVDAVSGSAFIIRREMFQTLGGFDECFFMYVEDTDLSWRARLTGGRCLYVAEAVVQHDYHLSYSPEKAFYLDRNRHFMLFKNLKRSTYLRMLPGILLSEIITWGFLLIKGPHYWLVKPKVYYSLFRHRKLVRQAHRRRKKISNQAYREIVEKMSYELEFEQLVNQQLARLAGLVFHPAFWVVRQLFARERSSS
jgi:GT2 family glycosyltransferase